VKRQEAVAILNELSGACHEFSVGMDYLFLKALDAEVDRNSCEYELHIRMVLNNAMQECIQAVLEKYRLSAKVSDDLVIISSVG
jgi:hypothetical protein